MTVLRKTREAAGMSQSQFARAAGLYATTVSRLEHAKEKAGPRLRARISTALQTEETALFAADGWPILTEAEALCSNALGCPVERLTVSREELERKCADLRQAWLLNQEEGAEQNREIDTLRARVAELEAQVIRVARDYPASHFLAQERDALKARVAELEAELAAERERRQFAEDAYAGAKWDSYECDRCGGADPADWVCE